VHNSPLNPQFNNARRRFAKKPPSSENTATDTDEKKMYAFFNQSLAPHITAAHLATNPPTMPWYSAISFTHWRASLMLQTILQHPLSHWHNADHWLMLPRYTKTTELRLACWARVMAVYLVRVNRLCLTTALPPAFFIGAWMWFLYYIYAQCTLHKVPTITLCASELLKTNIHAFSDYATEARQPPFSCAQASQALSPCIVDADLFEHCQTLHPVPQSRHATFVTLYQQVFTDRLSTSDPATPLTHNGAFHITKHNNVAHPSTSGKNSKSLVE